MDPISLFCVLVVIVALPAFPSEMVSFATGSVACTMYYCWLHDSEVG